MQTKYIIGIVVILIILSLIPVYFGVKNPGMKTQDVFNGIFSKPNTQTATDEPVVIETNNQATLVTASSSSSIEIPGVNSNVEISISNFAFSLPTVTVKKGLAVTWTNNDSMPHTVTADSKSFESKTLSKGEKFSFTFNSVGSFDYACSFHPSMRGKVVVTE